MSKYTPTFLFAALVELGAALLFVFVARRPDGSYNIPVVAVAAGLLLVATVITVKTALQMQAEKRGP